MHRLEASVRSSMQDVAAASGDGLFIVALSGGPDSVALLRALVALGYRVHAAHCNFHLRGAESDRDEAFCHDLCGRLRVPLHVVHFDTTGYASLHKVSIEMAARSLRYHWFAQLCRDIGAQAVCVAHHSDDQVETVLLNIIRGTGLRGLVGMRRKASVPIAGSVEDGSGVAQRGAAVLRPMLGVSEAVVMDYLDAIGQDFVVDSTNLQDEARRNKLRLDIIPRLEEINPAVKANIVRMTENLADVEAIVGESVGRAAADARITVEASPVSPCTPLAAYDFGKIKGYVAPRTLLWLVLEPYGFNRVQIGELATHGGGGGEWDSDGFKALLDRGRLYVVDRRRWERPMPSLRIPEAGLYRYMDRHVRVVLKPVNGSFTISKGGLSACLDAGKVTFPLALRPVKPGDRFTPYGMKGGKLVSDYLKDRKRDIIARHGQLVLADAAGRIVWLVGETIDGHCKVAVGTALALTVRIEQ